MKSYGVTFVYVSAGKLKSKELDEVDSKNRFLIDYDGITNIFLID